MKIPSTGRDTLAGTGMTRLGLAALLFAACTSSPPGPPGPSTQPTRIDLRAATGIADLTPVGITVDSAGTRYLFDEQLGIFELHADGGATRTMTMDALTEIKSPRVELPYTDLISIRPGLFALTAIGDGFLLDTVAGTLTQHFCYVPDGTPAWLWQRTDALAYDAVADRIYAQPQTYDTEGVLQATSIAAYDRITGGLTDWYPLEQPLFAGAMVVLPDQRILAAEGAELKHYEPGAADVTPILDLSGAGIAEITGLAYDDGKLLILDGAGDALHLLDAAEL
jgi:hypothetical protein